MKCHRTPLEGVLLIEPMVHRDERGFFLETYHQEKYAAAGLTATFVQDNHSKSSHGILRGLHAQRLRPQGKLVRAVEGEIFDIAADIRRGSPTYKQWFGARLSADNHHQLYIPPGFIHGFCVLSKTAQVEYKCTDLYVPADELSIVWNDPDIGIEWPIDAPVLSPRDREAPLLRDIEHLLPVYPATVPDSLGPETDR